jgi:hypothetical protein
MRGRHGANLTSLGINSDRTMINYTSAKLYEVLPKSPRNSSAVSLPLNEMSIRHLLQSSPL